MTVEEQAELVERTLAGESFCQCGNHWTTEEVVGGYCENCSQTEQWQQEEYQRQMYEEEEKQRADDERWRVERDIELSYRW